MILPGCAIHCDANGHKWIRVNVKKNRVVAPNNARWQMKPALKPARPNDLGPKRDEALSGRLRPLRRSRERPKLGLQELRVNDLPWLRAGPRSSGDMVAGRSVRRRW